MMGATICLTSSNSTPLRSEPVIVEHALLPVALADRAAFEAAFAQAEPLIAASPGFLGLDLHPPADGGDAYLLLVRWASIADHRDGFRQSERYEGWRALLHCFYPERPAVRYFSTAPIARQRL